MTAFNSEILDVAYDANSVLQLAKRVLDDGGVDDRMAGDIAWLLGRTSERLGALLDFLWEMNRETEISLADQIEALERRLAECRFALTAGASA